MQIEIFQTLTFLVLIASCKAKQLPKNAKQSRDESKLIWTSLQARSSSEWGEWTPFGPCSKTCGGGVKYRFRVCQSGKTLVPRSRCHGSTVTLKSCKTEPCRIKTAPPLPEIPLPQKTDLPTPMPPDPIPPLPEIPLPQKTDLPTPMPPDPIPPLPEIPLPQKTDLPTPMPPDPIPPLPEIPLTPKTDLLTPMPPDPIPPFPEIPFPQKTDLPTPVPPDPLPPFPEIPLTSKTDLLTPMPPDPLPQENKVSPPVSIWSEWGAYGPCSKTCGEGVRYRRRHCRSVHTWKDTCRGPAFDGISCKSLNCKEKTCNDLIHSKVCKMLVKQSKCKNEDRHWMSDVCRKSCDACNKDIDLLSANLRKKSTDDTCGQPIKHRIIGGETATLGDWPWQVAIAFKSNPQIVLCGGTLISDQWVLTASHCFISKYKQVPANIVVRMAETDLEYQESGKVSDVARLVRHEDFDRKTLDNDIALLKLVRPVEFNMLILPACLPSQDKKEVLGKECYITGWGNMGPNSFGSMVLQEAKIPITDKGVCRKRFSKLNIGITENMICAGSTNIDACQGDSGGPLVCKENGRYELTGIISFGYGCAKSDYHGVYTKVSNYIAWVEDHTQKADDF